MKYWGKPVVLAFLSAAVLVSGAGIGTAGAAETGTNAAAATQKAEPTYKVNASLRTEAKSVAMQRTATGISVAAVLRLKNVTGSVARVPDYELHVHTSDGVSYRLDASATNARSVRPQAEIEVSFMANVDGVDALDIASLRWVDVNKYVYPKKETVIVELPASGSVWTGIGAKVSGVAEAAWGQPFEIKALKSPLRYTAVAVNEQSSETGLSTVLKLLVQNPSAVKQSVPALTIEGHDGKEAFVGQRAEAGDIVLLPGEDTFIHMVLPKKPNSTFKNVVFSTTETFVSMASGTPQPNAYSVGRVSLALPAKSTAAFTAPRYTLGENVDVSKFSDAIPKEVKVALVEMSMHETTGASYQTVVAKVRVENEGNKALPIPPLLAELQSSEGYQYVGTRQSNAPTQVLPGLATVVAYTFTVPSSETGKDVTLKLQEPVVTASGAAYRSDLAAVKLDVEQPGSDRTFSFYPYTVQVKSKHLAWMYNIATGYSYKLKLNLEIQQDEQVVTDRDFSLMEIEIVDGLGRAVGSTELSFVNSLPNGNRRLLSGETVVNFANLNTEQAENQLTIRIYESIQTPTGTVRRLITSIK
ncbi:hypothetical protein FE782_19530 [Paenibacillus antri]|uniref:DUF11 domain-containing protein n=1 Tax=Paenibacillus antri TaxID=2582848 RepID=A0A5R9G2G9_9BACL|nr:hypothetical protein [Paenibacillus antri]TLS50557.1 hypothetical protein FE782_19530 [Paenibacillus antri]